MKTKLTVALSLIFPFISYASSENFEYKIKFDKKIIQETLQLSQSFSELLNSPNITLKNDADNFNNMIIDIPSEDTSIDNIIDQLKSELGDEFLIEKVQIIDLKHATQDNGRGI